MIYESSKHLFDIVLVWRYDRFARNLDDHGAYERLLHQNSVDLISATEEIPEGSHSAIIKAVILGGNESYSVELQKYQTECTAQLCRGRLPAGRVFSVIAL